MTRRGRGRNFSRSLVGGERKRRSFGTSVRVSGDGRLPPRPGGRGGLAAARGRRSVPAAAQQPAELGAVLGGGEEIGQLDLAVTVLVHVLEYAAQHLDVHLPLPPARLLLLPRARLHRQPVLLLGQLPQTLVLGLPAVLQLLLLGGEQVPQLIVLVLEVLAHAPQPVDSRQGVPRRSPELGDGRRGDAVARPVVAMRLRPEGGEELRLHRILVNVILAAVTPPLAAPDIIQQLVNQGAGRRVVLQLLKLVHDHVEYQVPADRVHVLQGLVELEELLVLVRDRGPHGADLLLRVQAGGQQMALEAGRVGCGRLLVQPPARCAQRVHAVLHSLLTYLVG
mmetsp:Transcript_36359/g.104008  ORF Transcript_36359/g.104008 Transcript_36359/m.104008 type:complete len:337 (-) Transcript_36359:188-1198(-)